MVSVTYGQSDAFLNLREHFNLCSSFILLLMAKMSYVEAITEQWKHTVDTGSVEHTVMTQWMAFNVEDGCIGGPIHQAWHKSK